MTPKHTPGPWYANDGQIYSEDSGITLALVPYYDKELPHKKADAALLAAAPDLLQACETALAAITELTDNWPMPVKALLPVKSLLQETIAKAQGA